MNILNDDVLKYILSFLKNEQITIISEVNSYFNKLIENKEKLFPSEKHIYSSLFMFEWALDHEYLFNRSINNRVKNYIEKSIQNNDNIDILNYISNNFYINKNNFSGQLYLKAYLMGRYNSYEWLKKNKFKYDCFYTSYNSYITKDIIKDKDLIFDREDFYKVVKTDDINEVKWILDSVYHLRQYVCLFASETNSQKVFKWAFHNYFDLNDIESIVENIKENNNNELFCWLLNQHIVCEYLDTTKNYTN